MTTSNNKAMRSQEITATTTTPSPNRSSPQNVDNHQGSGGGGGGGTTSNSPNWSKIQALKQRKSDLEKLLNEKNLMLQQIQRQEHQIIAGDYNYDHICRCNGGGAATLRRKIGTSFKMSTKNGCFISTVSKELGGSIGDMEKKVRQELLLKESNAIKPISRIHKAEYELAQQKLLAIQHLGGGVNLLKNHHQRSHHSISNNNTTDPIAITLDLTKPPSLVDTGVDSAKPGGETSSLTNSNKYGSNNSVNNNYYTTGERRNSIKSMQQQQSSQQHSPNSRNYDDNRSSTIALLKSHRSDYDSAAANRLLIVTPQNVGGSSGYLYENGVGGSSNVVLNGNNVMLDSNGFYTCSNVKYATSPIKNNNHRNSTIPSASMIDTLNYYPVQQQQLSAEQLQYDDAAALFLSQYAAFNGGGRNYHQYVGEVSDNVSLSPPASTAATTTTTTTAGPPFSSIHQQQTGLGGYWRTYGNERIWCTVDPSYDGSGGTQQNEKSIKSNTIAATPTKSLSLGNFDILSTCSSKDELIDKISISSMNSETNKQKQQKEKQWMETSLDGPMITTKQLQQQHHHQLSASPISSTSTTTYHHRVPPSQSHHHNHHHYNTVQQQQQLPPHSHHLHYNNSSAHYRDRSKLSSQSISNPASYRTIPKIEDQQYLSHSTSMLHSSNGGDGNDQSSHPINYHHHHQTVKKQSPTPSQSILSQHQQQRSASRIATSTSPIPPPAQLLKQQQQPQLSSLNPRSPIIANLTQQHHDTIRIESPKNMTVIQQAVFMPYKEISKPFEMSDFYKYSTKFRQKGKQQQQQVEVEQ